jgi:choline dehydrogenase
MLEQFNITVAQDLIGVGNNLQDHCMVHIDYACTVSPWLWFHLLIVWTDQLPGLMTPHTYQTNKSYDNMSEIQFITSKTGPWAGEPSTALAFPSLPQITNTTSNIVNAARVASRYWPSSYDSTLRHGYELQFDYTISRLLSNTTPAYEILNNNGGGLDVALMHPLSRGTVGLASADPFAAPLIDPRWLVNPFDTQVLVAAMQFNQRILNTPSIQQLQPSYDTVPQDASVDVLTAYLIKNLKTEYHYSGTCAMLPPQLGGVVDPNLLVYGAQNVRVVDTSVFPIIPSAHLQAVTYAVAEKVSIDFFCLRSDNADFAQAADIIKGVGTSSAEQVATPQAIDGFVDWLVHVLHL